MSTETNSNTDLVAVRATITGTHTGEFGGVAATGRPFTTSMISIELVADGRIAERWEQVDHAAVITQLTACGNGAPTADAPLFARELTHGE